jgi:hypothetical protein
MSTEKTGTVHKSVSLAWVRWIGIPSGSKPSRWFKTEAAAKKYAGVK